MSESTINALVDGLAVQSASASGHPPPVVHRVAQPTTARELGLDPAQLA